MLSVSNQLQVTSNLLFLSLKVTPLSNLTQKNSLLLWVLLKLVLISVLVPPPNNLSITFTGLLITVLKLTLTFQFFRPLLTVTLLLLMSQTKLLALLVDLPSQLLLLPLLLHSLMLRFPWKPLPPRLVTRPLTTLKVLLQIRVDSLLLTLEPLLVLLDSNVLPLLLVKNLSISLTVLTKLNSLFLLLLLLLLPLRPVTNQPTQP